MDHGSWTQISKIMTDRVLIMTDRPTFSDVLFGRGVATNRHPGNENFRAIVSKHVEAHVTSTKKQKMMMSRAVVEEVKTKLNPPGRFLEKNAETGLWHEVTDKRALEKTAQALRDGSAHLRQKLPEEVSDSASDSASFSEALSKGDVSSGKSFDQSAKKHIRTTAFLASSGTRRPQKLPKSNLSRSIQIRGWSPIEAEKSLFAPDNQNHSKSVHQSVQKPDVAMSQGNTESVPKNRLLSSDMIRPHNNGRQNEGQVPGDLHVQQTLADEFKSTFSLELEDFLKRSAVSDTSTRSTRKMSVSCSPTPPTTDSDEKNPNNAAASALVNIKNTVDDEEFEREMGPDEHFFGLGSTDPIGDDFDGDIL